VGRDDSVRRLDDGQSDRPGARQRAVNRASPLEWLLVAAIVILLTLCSAAQFGWRLP
jgi:hypothetical protein